MSAADEHLVVGVDVGGTHVTAAVFDAAEARIMRESLVRLEVDGAAPAQVILRSWTAAIGEAIRAAGVARVTGIGLGVPGPFDYQRGIAAIQGLQKYESLFGVNVKQWLEGSLRFDPTPNIVFRNDAECFALGEAWLGAGRGFERVVALTLGTGLGSAFIRDGVAVTSGDVPPSGWFYCLPLDGEIAEEHFSSRGLIRQFRRVTGRDIANVAELAARAREDAQALRVFQEFGTGLGRFLEPWLRKFPAQCLVVGGSIARSWDLFRDHLTNALPGIVVRPAELFEDAALCGAARVAQVKSSDESSLIRSNRRHSRQRLIPSIRPSVQGAEFDLYPALEIAAGQIQVGLDCLADAIARHRQVVIDGYVGLLFDDLRACLDAALRSRGIEPIWYETRIATKPSADIDRMIEAGVGCGGDPLSGTRLRGRLIDFYDSDLLRSIKPDADAAMCVLIGPGAALAEWDAPLVYLDLAKNEL